MRILYVEDQRVFADIVAKQFLASHEVVVAESVAAARAVFAADPAFDALLVDYDLPDGKGAEVIRSLRKREPHAAFLVLTGSVDDRAIGEAIEAGASGVLSKFDGIDAIVDAVRRVGEGDWLLTPHDIISRLQSLGVHREREREGKSALGDLTPREHEVLCALADGLSDKEIAQRLGIRPETARNHMVSILSKLGVESRLQALVFAIRHGAVSIQ